MRAQPARFRRQSPESDVGRALTATSRSFLFDEPSVGIDVGAKLESTNS